MGQISASLGVAMLPADATDAEGLLRKADRALDAAKKQGGNGVVAFARSTDQQPVQTAEAGTRGAWLRADS